MQVGKFGTKLFTVSSSKILTFSDLEISSSLSTSAGEVKGKKPTTTIKAPGLLKVPLTLDLHAGLGVGVQAEMDSWFAVLNAGKPYPLIICGRAVSVNSFLLDSCKASDLEIAPIGRKPLLTRAKLSLNFTEYLPPGVQAAAASGMAGAATGSTLTANSAYSVPSAAEKAALKRNNPGMG